jgi:hypothetical protein
MCEKFGWTEAEYNATSRQAIVEFSIILRTLEAVAKAEAETAEQQGKKKWPSISK